MPCVSLDVASVSLDTPISLDMPISLAIPISLDISIISLDIPYVCLDIAVTAIDTSHRDLLGNLCFYGMAIGRMLQVHSTIFNKQYVHPQSGKMNTPRNNQL